MRTTRVSNSPSHQTVTSFKRLDGGEGAEARHTRAEGPKFISWPPVPVNTVIRVELFDLLPTTLSVPAATAADGATPSFDDPYESIPRRAYQNM